MKKSQASLEFLIILSLILGMLIVTGFIVYQKYIRSVEVKVYVSGNSVARKVAEVINSANSVGEGYSQYLTIPGSIYGGYGYQIKFYRGEPTVFIYGGAFTAGEPLFWSDPIYTTSIECIMSECIGECNITPYDVCLDVSEMMRLKVSNTGNSISIGHPFNLRQGGYNWSIVPYRGKETATVTSTSNCTLDPAGVDNTSNSVMYIYKNTKSDTLNLIMKHGMIGDVGGNVTMNFTKIVGDPVVTLADDGGGEINMSRDLEGNWSWETTDCDGASIEFRSGAMHLCIIPINTPLRFTPDWKWLNGDGTEIDLNKNEMACISYP